MCHGQVAFIPCHGNPIDDHPLNTGATVLQRVTMAHIKNLGVPDVCSPFSPVLSHRFVESHTKIANSIK